jgi:ferredoxin, 2Fe-2S
MRWNTGLKVKYNGSVPTVTFLPLHASAPFEPSRLIYKGHGRPGSILDVALNFGIPLEHSCGGNCACTTCHVIVREGDLNLSMMEETEADRLEMASNLTLHSRLACQAVVEGDVTVEIPEE